MAQAVSRWPLTSESVAVPGQSVHTVSVTVTGVCPLSVSSTIAAYSAAS